MSGKRFISLNDPEEVKNRKQKFLLPWGFSFSLTFPSLFAAGATLRHSFANSVTWENRRKNVFGFVEQSSFFTQLRYGAILLIMKPSLSGSASSSDSTSKVCFSPLWPNVYASVGPFVQFLNIIETSTPLSSIFNKNFL